MLGKAVAAICLGIVASLPVYAQLTEESAAGAGAQDDALPVVSAAAKPHFDAALKAAGTDFPGPLRLCNQARPRDARWTIPEEAIRPGPSNAELLRLKKSRAQYVADGGKVVMPPGPTRLFDNFYWLGIESVSAWALDTRDGIILIDALENGAEWTDRIEPGMRKLGLDPARIKYVVLTHGHGDHFGGAAYLKQTYRARVLMSDIDWEIAPRMLDKPYFGAPPPKDMSIADGQKLTLGGQTITLWLTPGHTRGTVSMVIPVTDRGRKHVAVLWGGTGFNFPHTPDRFKIYADSAARFRGLAAKAGADVILSPHPDFDSTFAKLARLSARTTTATHPHVIGKDKVGRFLTTAEQCALAYGHSLRTK